MSRWFRFYSGVVGDAKAQMLSPELFKYWVNVLCIAAQNDGELPSLAITAYTLRLPDAKAAGVLSKLYAAGLLDKTEKGFKPHNWDARQYKNDKTDNTNAERQERYRNKMRNGSNAKSNAHSNGVTAVSVKRPDNTETEADSETDKKGAEPIGSDAVASVDHRKRLFDVGLTKLGALTGKGPDACRSFVGKCLKAASDDAITVLGLIEDAERNRVVDPSGWISARLKGTTGPPAGKQLTEHQRLQHKTRDIIDGLGHYATGSGSGSENDPRLLLDHSGGRS